MCPYIRHSIQRMTFASMCDASICDKIGTGKGLCLVSSLFPDPCEFLPTLPRYHQGAIDLRWLLRWTGCQRNSNIWQTDFVAIKGMKAELQLDEGTNMINMMRLYSLWGKILDSLNWWRPTSSKNHSISGVSKDPCCESISAGSVVLSARKESNPQPQN